MTGSLNETRSLCAAKRPQIRALAAAVFLAAAVSTPPAHALYRPWSDHSKLHHGKHASDKRAREKQGRAKGDGQKPGGAEATPNPDAAAPEPPPPYEPLVLRLAEILGALTYLDELCAVDKSIDLRARMQNLLEAEGATKFRRDRLAGTFNRSYRGYERSYQACTANAQVIIGRFLNEGAAISRDLLHHYRAS